MMEKIQRFKRAEAVAIEYGVTCPYKPCGIRFKLPETKKGDVVTCPNCNKKVRIEKVR